MSIISDVLSSPVAQNIALGTVRHLVGAGAAALVSAGVLQASQTDAFLGSILFLATLIWSALAKATANRALKDTALASARIGLPTISKG